MTTASRTSIAPQQVIQWHSYFLQLNQARLEAARSLLLPRQQLVLDVLPLLLHLNHPRLPGFIDFRTAAGIRNYSPTNQQLQSLQALARGVQIPRGSGGGDILGLYLMGSIGSLAQARSSDLDMWLCHDETLPPQALAGLQQKCQLLERWAAEQGIELHIFLMNLTEFRQGQNRSAEGEDCGTTQHLLLLDEFYRSAVWLAGCMPRWWLIPNQEERNADRFWQQLADQHRVNPVQWLDFGAIPAIPPAEFIGAGLWQLNKGLSDPYKSLLKLLLTRHYASQYPVIRPLCWDLKEQVHNGNIELQPNDAYLLLLRRITQQLEQEGNPERVQLARRAFYFKAKLPLSQLGPSQRSSWRTAVLQALCNDWGWQDAQLAELDARPHWSPQRIASERNSLISEMLSSYRFLAAFSQKYAPRLHISKQDMQSLGNQLYAAFDNRPGKIVNINPGISPSLAQEKITLNLQQDIWQLIPGLVNPVTDSLRPDHILKQSPSLTELLCFARLNGLLQDYTRIALYPQHNPLSAYELKQILQVVQGIQPPQPNHADFLQPARPLQWHLLVNVGVDPQHHLSRLGMQKISNRDDALGFSAARENLVLTIDLVTLNNWGEWQVERFSGDACLLHCLQHLLQHLPKVAEQGWPKWQVHCHCASRAAAIRHRVEQVLQDVLGHFVEQPRSPYLLEVAECYYLLENTRRGVELRIADTPMKLLALLQRPARSFIQYTLDRSALQNSPLQLIFSHSKAGLWQLFYWRKDGRLYFYFLDEKGVLLHQQWPDTSSDPHSLPWLLPLLRFLRQLDQRWQRLNGRSQERKIVLWELRRKAQSFDFEIARRRLPELAAQTASIDLRAVLNSQQQATLYCNGQEFNSWEYGSDLYPAVIRTVQALRSSHGNYPLALSDLELPDNQNIITHLQIRQRLENRLAQAQQDAG